MVIYMFRKQNLKKGDDFPMLQLHVQLLHEKNDQIENLKISNLTKFKIEMIQNENDHFSKQIKINRTERRRIIREFGVVIHLKYIFLSKRDNKNNI